MKIVLTGPIQVAPLKPWLDVDAETQKRLPRGRGGTAVTQLARGLLQRGHQVGVVSLDTDVTDEVHVRGPSLSLRLGPYRSHHRARDAFRTERRYVAAAVVKERPDIVHANWTYEYALGALAAGAPTLVTVRDWAPTILRLHPVPYRAVRLAMNAATLARATHLTVASPIMARRLRRWKKVPAEVIPNALDDTMFHRRTYPPNRHSPCLLAVNAGFGRIKNVTTLLVAFAAMRSAWPEARLRLVGNAYHKHGSAAKWARARDLHWGVDFYGPVPHEDIIPLMRNADVFVHPGLEESFGMVLIEAMSQGLPVVAGAHSGAVPWILNNGRAGLLTDVSSADKIAGAVTALIADEQLWQSYSEAGFERAYASFRLSVVIDRYLAVYTALAAEARP